MRRLRIAVVAALVGLSWTAPVTARADGPLPSSWAALVGPAVERAADPWRMVAGSSDAPPAENSNNTYCRAVDGSEGTAFGTAELEGEKFPTIDPNG